MPPFLKHIVAGVTCLLVSLFFGFWVGTEDYFYFAAVMVIALVTITILVPGYAFLMAFGLLCPFALPLPFVYGMPLLALVLGLILTKVIVRRTLEKRSGPTARTILPLSIILFFGWIGLQYAMNPVLPGIAIGVGENVSGFRAYANYALCFVLLLCVGFLFQTREQLISLVRWMALISAVFALILIPLIFTKSLSVGTTLARLGLYVTFFDNGWLRFVSLAEFGTILFTLSLLPTLLPGAKYVRLGAFMLGLAAIVMGGNRSAVVMAFAILLVIAVLRRRVLFFVFAVVFTAALLLVLNYVGENLPSTQGVGFLRVAALVSGRAAEMTDAAESVLWRKIRWDRAMQDVYSHPFVGVGYGGLERAFIFSDRRDYEQSSVEIDVASGTIHNGYIAGARALGIPALLLFVYILVRQTMQQSLRAMRSRFCDPHLRDLHCFVAAHLIATAIHAYIGLDLNSSRLWFFIGFALLLLGLKAREDLSAPNQAGGPGPSAQLGRNPVYSEAFASSKRMLRLLAKKPFHPTNRSS
jgi:hypothetical protein